MRAPAPALYFVCVSAPVVLVTDYGTDDTYAAALVGACLRVDADLLVVSATHGVPPGDVLGGAYHLKAAAMAFPAGTVLCAVVDPGVGTGRRALALRVGTQLCVAPDNGLASYLWEEADPGTRSCVVLETPPDASATFAGRDLFAPVAAALAVGVDLAACGVAGDPPLLLGSAFVTRGDDTIAGTVCAVDHFGNAITTLRRSDLGDAELVSAAWPSGSTRRVAHSYADAGDGLALIIGGAGHIEVAADRRRAVEAGGPQLGEVVRFRVAER